MKLFLGIPSYATTIPQRHRQTTCRSKNRALCSIARQNEAVSAVMRHARGSRILQSVQNETSRLVWIHINR